MCILRHKLVKTILLDPGDARGTLAMKRLQKALLAALFMLAAAGCTEPAPDKLPVVPEGTLAQVEQRSSVSEGSYLFVKETFQGNGRTCSTCHTMSTGTLSPAQVAAQSPPQPIFRAIDSDDGTGSSYTKLKTDATVTVTLSLPPNIRLASNPTARTVKLRRGIPATVDSPVFDPVLMLDGRETTLQHQAVSAALEHLQALRAPTANEQDSLVLFQKTRFTSAAMQAYAGGTGPAPALPTGNTASEQRGAAFFAPTGKCGSCHGGTLLNTMTASNPLGLPAGARFASAYVSEFNMAGNPVLAFIVTQPDGTEAVVYSPDPGQLLATGNLAHANAFKMESLRNLKNTAPYFHDNSAKTIDAAMSQHKTLLNMLGTPLTAQDVTDITAYLYLL
jgi:cytochrome c peroxidase